MVKIEDLFNIDGPDKPNEVKNDNNKLQEQDEGKYHSLINILRYVVLFRNSKKIKIKVD